mgnify:CR=1 FL=1
MSASFRPRRVVPSAVNTPTAIHVYKSANISNADAEEVLSEFISVSELIATTVPGATGDDDISNNKTGFSNSTGNSAVLGQLRRVQRDLRGLPPLVQEPESKKHKFDEDTQVEPVNKKIKFDDSDEEDDEKEEQEDVEEQQVENDDEEDEPETVEQEAEKEVDEDEQSHSKKKEKKEKKEKKSKKEKKHKKEKHLD